MIKHLIFLALTTLPFNSYAFDEKIRECRESYERFFLTALTLTNSKDACGKGLKVKKERCFWLSERKG